MFVEFKTASAPQTNRFFNIPSTKNSSEFFAAMAAAAEDFSINWPKYFGIPQEKGLGREAKVDVSVRLADKFTPLVGCTWVVYVRLMNSLFLEVVGVFSENGHRHHRETVDFFREETKKHVKLGSVFCCGRKIGSTVMDDHPDNQVMIVANTHLEHEGCLVDYELLSLDQDFVAGAHQFNTYDVGYNNLLRSLEKDDGPGPLVIRRETNEPDVFISHFKYAKHTFFETRFIKGHQEKIIAFREWYRARNVHADYEATKLFREENDLALAIQLEVQALKESQQQPRTAAVNESVLGDEMVMVITPKGMFALDSTPQHPTATVVGDDTEETNTRTHVALPTIGQTFSRYAEYLVEPDIAMARLGGDSVVQTHVFHEDGSRVHEERPTRSLANRLKDIANNNGESDDYENTPIQFRNPRVRIVNPVFGISANTANLFDDDLATLISKIGVFERSVITHPEYTGYVIRLCAHATFYDGDNVLVHTKDDIVETISVLVGGEIDTVPEEWFTTMSSAAVDQQTTFFFNLFMEKISSEYLKIFGQPIASDEWSQILANYESGLGSKFMVLMPDTTDKNRKSAISFCTWVNHPHEILAEKADTVCYYDHTEVYAMTDVLVSWDKIAVGGSPAAGDKLILINVESVEDATAAEQALLIETNSVQVI